MSPGLFSSKKYEKSNSVVSNSGSRQSARLNKKDCSLYYPDNESGGKLLFSTSKSAPASRTTSLVNTTGRRCPERCARDKVPKPRRTGKVTTTNQPQSSQLPPLPSTTTVFDSNGKMLQAGNFDFPNRLITPVTSDRSWKAKESLKCPTQYGKNQFPKIKTPCLLVSETKQSYKPATAISCAVSLKDNSQVKFTFPQVVGSTRDFEVSQCVVKAEVGRQTCEEQCAYVKGGECEEHASDKMKTARSEISLLEQKRLQWAKEREELSGLWSPWGRQAENILENRVSPNIQMQGSYPSPTNVVSSSYMANLESGSSPYSPSYSECYLPPINSTIAQQPRQKAKVWNAEFQQEDYRYENGHASSLSNHRYSLSNAHRGCNAGLSQGRKASLPNYMYEGGDIYPGNGNIHHHHKHHDHHNVDGEDINQQHHVWSASAMAMDEEAFTSGYYSENNNNNVDDGKSSSCKKQEVVLTPTSRERSYQQEITVQKAISVRGDSNASPTVIAMHKLYSQNGEVFMMHDGNQEVIVNSMTVSANNGANGNTGVQAGELLGERQQQHQQDLNRSPGGRLPRNHAMRSSLTIGVDASTVDAYNELDRREKQQWLSELEKQREEQRLRKMMEKEERRPRWGDRGIGVGHFWEPSESRNSHLPAPPNSSRGKMSLSCRGESSNSNFGGDIVYSPIPFHTGQSQTPPAWLERSLTRMQSSKSQPSLHEPDYIHDSIGNENPHENAKVSKSSHQLLSSSRSLNHSTSDLVGFNSPIGDHQSDRTYVRGQNKAIDPDTLTELEKKRLANQEHLEALKKQIEAKQQKQKEEKELRLQEEREHEIRIAKQQEIELQRLEKEKRGKMPVNGDMPNSIEDTAPESREGVDCPNVKAAQNSTQNDSSQPLHDPEEEKDIEIVQRQSVMVTTVPVNDDDDKTTESSETVPYHRPRLSRQDQSVMTDVSDPSFERTLTPSFQRSRSLSITRSIREFGTQTELSDGSTSSGSGSICGSGKNSDKNRSHNSLLDKKAKEKKQDERKPEERPRWGSNPVKKLYVKQSEKDPNYVSRIKRRQERLKRMEEERSFRGDTGTESEDVSIPFHRIRQRRSDASPPRRVSKGPAPLKATALQKTDNGPRFMTASSSESAPLPPQQPQREQVVEKYNGQQDKGTGRVATQSRKSGVESDAGSTSFPQPHSIKNAKSETHLNKQQNADIIDRNFGSVAGINVLSGMSEESSGFSTPFLARRNIGSGSTESGTTGSGSGVQSPDLTYHKYQANKSTREERKYAKITSGRDTHAIVSSSSIDDSKNGAVASETITDTTTTECANSVSKGFIHQKEFDEIPIKSAQGNREIFAGDIDDNSAVNVYNRSAVNDGDINTCKTRRDQTISSPRRRMTASSSNISVSSGSKQQQRNKSMSPQRKPRSPVKVKSNENKRTLSKSMKHITSPAGKNNRNEEINLPNIPQEDPARATSPPVPALLKKMQMGLQPDESGRMSSLPSEFPDILAPLPMIPIGLVTPNHSRLSSATSGLSGTSSQGKIDIDIAVTPRNNPEIIRLFEAAEERIKQRQLSAILAGSTGKLDNDSGKSRTSFEADIGRISINLEPVILFPAEQRHSDEDGIDDEEMEMDGRSSVRMSSRSHQISPRPGPSPRDAAMHEAFITSILNSKEVKEQLSARESELSEKGIIEFSIRLPSTSSGDEFTDEYKDPLLTERRRHTAQWLYGGQNVPQKQAILTNLASLKQGIALQQKEWNKVNVSDAE